MIPTASAGEIHPIALPHETGNFKAYDAARDPARMVQEVVAGRARQGDGRADGGERRKSAELSGRSIHHAVAVGSAQASGRILDSAPLGARLGEPWHVGGGHVVYRDTAEKRIYKLTKPGFYGMKAGDFDEYRPRWAIRYTQGVDGRRVDKGRPLRGDRGRELSTKKRRKNVDP